MKKVFFIVLGSITFAIGTLGIFLPLLPTTGFYVATAFFWMRSSDRLYEKFIQSNYYRKYIKETLLEKKITVAGRVKLFLSMFFMFLIPCLIVRNQLMSFTLAIVFLLHLIFLNLYFNKKAPMPLKDKK